MLITIKVAAASPATGSLGPGTADTGAAVSGVVAAAAAAVPKLEVLDQADRTKASCLPSGDQRGVLSYGPAWRCNPR